MRGFTVALHHHPGHTLTREVVQGSWRAGAGLHRIASCPQTEDSAKSQCVDKGHGQRLWISHLRSATTHLGDAFSVEEGEVLGAVLECLAHLNHAVRPEVEQHNRVPVLNRPDRGARRVDDDERLDVLVGDRLVLGALRERGREAAGGSEVGGCARWLGRA